MSMRWRVITSNLVFLRVNYVQVVQLTRFSANDLFVRERHFMNLVAVAESFVSWVVPVTCATNNRLSFR